MSETNRYVLLDRELRRKLPGSSPTHGAGSWVGTGERLQAAAPTQGSAGSLPKEESWSASVGDRTARAFDDGAPIELRYDEAQLCKSAPAPAVARAAVSVPRPAAVTVLPVPADQPHPPAPTAVPATPAASGEHAALGPGAEAKQPVPTGAPGLSDLAAAESDDDFAAQVRELLEVAAKPAAPPPGASAPVVAAPAGTPTAPAPPAEDTSGSPADRYAVFEQIGQSLSSARTFDLGTVPVTAAFDAIESAMRREQRGSSPVRPAPALDRMDLVEDLATMPHRQQATALQAPAWVDYRPAAPDTLVIGAVEHPAPPGVTLRNWTSPGVAQFRGRPQQRTRPVSEVRQIVIHETVTPTWGDISGTELGVQFHLDRDGGLVQHNDAVDMLWHVKTFSEHSTGIETVSVTFDKDSAANKGEPDPGERIPVTWGGQHGGFYVLPPAVQMEALAATVGALRERLGIPDNWMQVVQHPDRSQPELADRWFFILHTNGHLYFPEMKAEPWVASHSVLRDHVDGAFPTLYCYLRLHGGRTPEASYQLASQIVEDPGGARRRTYFDAASTATLNMVDITDVV